MNETNNQRSGFMTNTERLELATRENLVNMLKYDGIIKETAVEALEAKYPYAVIAAAMNYAEHSENMLTIMSACNEAFENKNNYLAEFVDEDGDYVDEVDDFIDWYLDNTARLADEECRRLTKENAREHDERMRINALLRGCDILQKELLKLTLGYEGAKLTAKEIAALPGFKGQEGYINIILKRMGDTTAHSKRIAKRQKNKEVNGNAKV